LGASMVMYIITFAGDATKICLPNGKDSLIGKYLKQTKLILITKDFASYQ
jgi:hypothetical protein